MNTTTKKRNKKSRIVATCLLGLAFLIFALYNSNLFSEKIPSIIHRMELEGDFRGCLHHYHISFGDEIFVMLDNVAGESMNISLMGWGNVKQAIFFKDIYPDERENHSLNFKVINWTKYTATWGIDLPGEVGDVKIILDEKISLENDNGKIRIVDVMPNGRFDFYQTKDLGGNGCFRMNLFLNDYECYGTCLISDDKNVNGDVDPNFNVIRIDLESDEDGNYGNGFGLHLYTYDRSKKLWRDFLYLLIIPFIILALQYLLKIFDL